MIAVIVTLFVHPGQEAAVEDAFTVLAAQVRANEPGNRLYQLARPRAEPGVYRVIEIYADDEAIRLHGKSAYFAEAMERMKPCFSRPAEVQMMDTVG